MIVLIFFIFLLDFFVKKSFAPKIIMPPRYPMGIMGD